MRKKFTLLLFSLFIVAGNLAVAQVEIYIPDLVVSSSESTVNIPIVVEGIEPDNINGFTFKIGFDPAIISIDSFSKTSTLSSGFSIQANNQVSGSFTLSGAGTNPITNSGEIINLVVTLNSPGVSEIEFLQAEINEGDPSFSTINGSITVVSPSEPTTLLAPDDGSTGLLLNPTLRWRDSEIYSSFEVQVSEDESFSSTFVVNEVIDSDTTLQLNSPEYSVENNTEYFWRVRATDETNSSNWSATYSFTTQAGAAPESPVLVSPTDEATNLTISPMLEWNASESAESYQVQVANSSSFSSFIEDETTSETTFNIDELEYGTKYFWRVRGINTAGTSEWSGIRSFTTIVQLPSVTSLTTPANEDDNLEISLELNWSNADRASFYTVQLATNNDFSPLISEEETTETSLQLSDLDYKTTYYWRVKATNVGGESNWSNTFSFTTIIKQPEVAGLLFPENNATAIDTLVTLVWASAERAESSRIQLSEANTFTSTFWDETLSDTVLSVGNLDFSTTYYWRVKSINAGGESEWSTEYQFTTGDANAGVPSLVTPANNSTATDTALTFTWSTAENAVEYEVQISENANFNSLIKQNAAIADTFVTFNSFDFETRYYWRVRAFAENTTSAWSSTFNFITAERENEPPYVEDPISSVSLFEDFGVETIADLDEVFADRETSTLSYEIVSSPDVVEVSISERQLVFNSIENEYGSGELVISASDEDGASISTTVEITVNAVNDLPFFVEVPDTLTFVSGAEYTFEFGELVSDIEDNLAGLTFNYNLNPSDIIVEFSISDYSITFTAPDFSGEGTLSFTVSDSDGGDITVEIIIVVEMSTSTSEEVDVPTEFSLSQNYPNPFNPTTKIQYQLPSSAPVSFAIYDMTGREVFSQINQQKSPGTHIISFDASSLSSGIYIYQLKAAEFTETKKMTLIK